MMQAAVRRTYADAIRGAARPQELILRHMAQISLKDEALETDFMKAMIEPKVYGEKELERRARPGLTDEPELVPHPDDIHIDFQTGDVRVRGLQSEEERRASAQLRDHAETLREDLVALAKITASEKSAKKRKEMEKMRVTLQAKLDATERALSF